MSTLYVICRIAGAEYAIAGDEVMQMESYAGATSVPGAPSHVVGLVQVRQQVLPLVDARARLGLARIDPTLESRVVVLRLGDRLVGVLVDSAREIVNIPPEHFREPPDLVARQSAGLVRSVAQLGGRIILLLDTAKLVGQEGPHA
jgi:purine-binding chemotaxis protein CheW